MWVHFGNPVYAEDNGKRVTDRENAVCRLCNTLVKNSGGTKNLWFHLERHHPAAHSKLSKSAVLASPGHTPDSPVHVPEAPKSAKRPTIASLFEKKQQYPDNSIQAKNKTDSIGLFLVGDLQPVSVVDRPYFKHMIQTIDPKNRLPSRRYFKDQGTVLLIIISFA